MLYPIRCIIDKGTRPFAAFLVLLAGCSSNNPTPGGGTGAPASIAVASGDGQSAAAGSALPVPLSVVVKDTSGAAVSGAVVAFTVDSGGGSLAAASATTGSNGVAVAGTWTLGAGTGSNVVRAKVTTLTPVTFHAQALGATARPVFTGAAVGAAGGTLQYTKPGDPLNGLTVTVPAGAFPTATRWTVVADSGVRVPLPSGFSQVGPALIVSNGQGYADSVMTLTMPMPLAANIAVAPFYFDPTTKTLEGIPLVARTATSVTLATRHFSGDLLAIPRSGAAGGLRAARLRGFGDVEIVWVQTPQAQLVGTYTTGFQVGVDNWEFVNNGDYISPGGDCEGMSITEMYYYYFKAAGGGPRLYHHFDASLANPYDNVQGIRFAGSVQGDYDARWASGVNQIAQLMSAGAANGVSPATLTSTWILLTLQVTRQPVLMALFGPPGGHAVVAYAATSTSTETDVSFADPNYPSALRTMTFVGGQLTPITLQTNANAPGGSFTTAYAVGVSADVPITSIDSRWSDFVTKTSGQDRYPPQYTLEAFDSVNQAWNSLTDTVRTTINAVKLRVRCPSCTQRLRGAPADLQQMIVYNDSGTILASPKIWDGSVFTLTNLALGKLGYVAVANAASPYASPPGGIGFLDSSNFAVIFGQLAIAVGGLYHRPDTAYTLVTANGGLATPTSTFIWDFGDGTAAQLVVGDSTVRHSFAAIGTYPTSVEMLDGSGKLVGRDSSVVTVTHLAWQLNTAGVTSVLPTGGIGSDPLDTLTQRTVNAALSSLSGALLFRVDSAACSAVVLELGGGPDSGLVASSRKAVLASNCGGFFGAFQMGTLGIGTVSGDVSLGVVRAGALLSASNGSLDAVMIGATLSGTFIWTVPYTGGNGVYTVQFSAIQVEPPPI